MDKLGPVIDNSTGMATFGGISMGSQAGASGTGVIAVISLEAQDVPALSNSPLDLDGIQVTDTGGTTIEPICVNDGSATVDNCEPVWGADFSWYYPVRTSRTTSFNTQLEEETCLSITPGTSVMALVMLGR